jgi:PAS domain-containing protein
MKIRRPIGDLCVEIADLAKRYNHETLSYLLRMAALEAYEATQDDEDWSVTTTLAPQPASLIVGVWDWDVAGGLIYTDANCATLFGLDPVDTAKGLPLDIYLRAIDSEDLPAVIAAIQSSVENGGQFDCQCRLTTSDQVRWIRGLGNCTLGNAHEPLRFPGAILDITAEKLLN